MKSGIADINYHFDNHRVGETSKLTVTFENPCMKLDKEDSLKITLRARYESDSSYVVKPFINLNKYINVKINGTIRHVKTYNNLKSGANQLILYNLFEKNFNEKHVKIEIEGV